MVMFVYKLSGLYYQVKKEYRKYVCDFLVIVIVYKILDMEVYIIQYSCGLKIQK